MDKELDFMETIKKDIIKRSYESFGYAGCVESESGYLINTGNSKQVFISIKIKEKTNEET